MLPTPPLPPTDAAVDATADAAVASPAPGGGEPLAIRFTGSGSEYFRIWSINLLLTLITFGLYHPWAKVRRLRYFYGNTLVGDHPLDFHGEPRRMLRGFLLVGALAGLYSVAGSVSPAAGLAAFVIVAAVWPALFRASQQFRLANTSWRGLRFHFTGNLGGAYRAMLPLFGPGLIVLAGVLFGGDAEEMRPGARPPPGGIVVGLVMLAAVALAPLLWWLIKKYQHDHLALGPVQTQLRTGAGSFYWVCLKTFGVSLLAGFSAGLVAALLAGGSLAAVFGGRGNSASKGAAAAAVFGIAVLVLAMYAAMALVIRPYLTSRFQNLVWNRTKSTDIRFESALRFWPLFRMTLKNWLLVLLTLGFYWPFAAVALARLRLQSVTVHTRRPADELVSRARVRAQDASGDAAGDLFGIDIGL